MNRPYAVMLADDHAIVREGLRLIVGMIEGMCVAGEAADGEAVLHLLKERPGDALVLDLGMPGVAGLAFIRQLREFHPRLKILILTANVEPRMVRAALEAGADGYMTKHDGPGELSAALEAMRAGETYLAAKLRYAVDGTGARKDGEVSADTASPIALTRREKQVLALIAQGATARDMAERLGISPLTARKHRENLMRKLDLHSVAEVTAYAVRLGLPTG
jgi:DNA-binding NarL/FixJ family response regulator